MPQLPAGLGWTSAGAAQPAGMAGMALPDPNKKITGGMSAGV
jgi:hypothetical protein